jgi:hypothetical protein
MLPEERRRNPAPSGVGGCQTPFDADRVPAYQPAVTRSGRSELRRGDPPTFTLTR